MFNIVEILNQNTEKKEFLSCEALNSRLVFFGKKVAYCSNGNPSQNMKYPVIYDNFTGKLNIKELEKHIKQDRKNIRNGKVIKNCEGCQGLQYKNWQQLKGAELGYVQFSDYGLCNSKCIYCNSWTETTIDGDNISTISGKPDSYEIMPIIKNLIKRKMINQNTIIDFAGGEPTVYRQFEEALIFLLDFGIKHIEIFSNSILYSNIIERGLKDGIVNLTVSIDAGSKEIHKKIKGVESYDVVYSNLKKYAQYQKYKNQVIAKYVIVSGINDNEDELLLWMNKTNDIGINKLILNADNRIFEKEPDKELSNKLMYLTNFFEQKATKQKREYEIYSNLQFLRKSNKDKKFN